VFKWGKVIELGKGGGKHKILNAIDKLSFKKKAGGGKDLQRKRGQEKWVWWGGKYETKDHQGEMAKGGTKRLEQGSQ